MQNYIPRRKPKKQQYRCKKCKSCVMLTKEAPTCHAWCSFCQSTTEHEQTKK